MILGFAVSHAELEVRTKFTFEATAYGNEPGLKCAQHMRRGIKSAFAILAPAFRYALLSRHVRRRRVRQLSMNTISEAP